jgi:hypothetical protein
MFSNGNRDLMFILDKVDRLASDSHWEIKELSSSSSSMTIIMFPTDEWCTLGRSG